MKEELRQRKQIALHNILQVLVQDFKKLDDIEQYPYKIEEKDFDEKIEKLLFRAVKKYRPLGVERITKKILSDMAILESDFEAFIQSEKKDPEYKANFPLYVKDLQVVKMLETFETIQNVIHKNVEKVSGDALFQKAEQFVEFVHHQMDKLRPMQKLVKGKTMIELNQEFMNWKEDQQPIKTGLDIIDEKFGGWKRGGINLLSGVSNQGKTTFIIQCILYAVVKLGLKVKLINLELAEQDIYAKIMGLLSEKGYHAHNIASYDTRNEEERIAHQNQAKEDKEIITKYIQDRLVIKTGTFTPEMLYEELRESEREKFDMVVVDYFQLVQVGGSDKERAARLSKLQEEVRAIVRNCHFAFIWVTQLKEEVEKDKNGQLKVHPMEYEIAWCRDLYKGADLELRIWRTYANIETRTFTNDIWIGFKKTRFTKRFDPVCLAFDGELGRIGEIASFIEKDGEKVVQTEEDFFDSYDEIEYFWDEEEEYDPWKEIENEKEEEERRKKYEEEKQMEEQTHSWFRLIFPEE